jgi:hypothetical protein
MNYESSRRRYDDRLLAVLTRILIFPTISVIAEPKFNPMLCQFLSVHVYSLQSSCEKTSLKIGT